MSGHIMYLYRKCSFLSQEVLYVQERYNFDLASSIHYSLLGIFKINECLHIKYVMSCILI